MPTVVKCISDCSAVEIETFVELVNAGGKVKPGLRDRVAANAYRLAFHLTEAGKIIAVAALKSPKAGYRTKVFQKAKTNLNPEDYPLEFGWMAVSPAAQGQGVSRVLAEAILPLAAGKNVYATTEEANERMRRTNARLGFEVSGQAYFDDEGIDRLLLYVRSAR